MGNRNQFFFFLFGVMGIFRRRQYGGDGTTNTWEMGTGVHRNFGGSDTASTGIQHGTWDMGNLRSSHIAFVLEEIRD